MDTNFSNYQNSQREGGQYNVLASQKKYTILTFKLDQATTLGDSMWKMNFPIRSFWVREASKDFKASIKLNHQNDEGDALPLSRNMNLGYEFPQAGAAFEWPAQPGKSIQIVFAHDSIIDVGLVENELNAEFSLKALALPEPRNVVVQGASISGPVILAEYSDSRDHVLINNSLSFSGWGCMDVGIYDPQGNMLTVLRPGDSLKWNYKTPVYGLGLSPAFGADFNIKIYEVMK